MSIYTYVVDHGNENPSVGVGTVVNGGKIKAVAFEDSLAKLQEAIDFLNALRDETTCNKTRYEIDDFLH